jgi:hypothetical protein
MFWQKPPVRPDDSNGCWLCNLSSAVFPIAPQKETLAAAKYAAIEGL